MWRKTPSRVSTRPRGHERLACGDGKGIVVDRRVVGVVVGAMLLAPSAAGCARPEAAPSLASSAPVEAAVSPTSTPRPGTSAATGAAPSETVGSTPTPSGGLDPNAAPADPGADPEGLQSPGPVVDRATPAAAPEVTFLAPDELPPELGMAEGQVEKDPVERMMDEEWALLDAYAATIGSCDPEQVIESLDDLPAPLGWRAVQVGNEAGLLGAAVGAGAPGTRSALPVFGVLQGATRPADATAVLAAKRAEVEACPPPGTLPYPLDEATESTPVRLEVPELGDEAVAWRYLGIFPEAFVVMYDTVWWRNGDDVGAVMIMWAPGSLPGAGFEEPATPTPSEPFDPAAWLAATGEAEVTDALFAVAAELDDRL